MVKKLLWKILGILFVILGTAGIFLPLLPTTPFLLLAAACFLNSSQELHDWLVNHKVFGKFIKDYIKHKAIPLKSKIIAIALVWIAIGYSAIYVIDLLIIKIILVIIAIGVSAHLIGFKTLK